MLLRRISFAAALLSVMLAPVSLLADEADPPKVRFETQIQPVLEAKCKRCHGGEKRNADLSLASGRDVLKGSESGPVIVAGKPDESLLVEMIKGGEMPPKDNPALTPTELELIRRWIAEGATFADSPPLAAEVTQH